MENSFPVHPEVLLYNAFQSNKSSKEIRHRALEVILQARQRAIEDPSTEIRKFVYPVMEEINFDAENIMESFA